MTRLFAEQGPTGFYFGHNDFADDASFNDHGSVYTASIAESSDSLCSSVFDYKIDNGRTYPAYGQGLYYMPNDEREQDRLDLHHYIYLQCLNGQLHVAPIQSPRRVLDAGTGTGIWAVEFADTHPDAVVIGVDLSPIQPDLVPPNLKFYVDDLEISWSYEEHEKFDYIHWRSLYGSTKDWPKLYQEAYRNLRPGSYLEVHEYDMWIYSDDDPNLDKAPWTRLWINLLSIASAAKGQPMNVGYIQKQYMEEAGFLNVHEHVVRVPIGQWTQDFKSKEMGVLERIHMRESIESHSLFFFTHVLGYTLDETHIIFSLVMKEIDDQHLRMYTIYRFLFGHRGDA